MSLPCACLLASDGVCDLPITIPLAHIDTFSFEYTPQAFNERVEPIEQSIKASVDFWNGFVAGNSFSVVLIVGPGR